MPRTMLRTIVPHDVFLRPPLSLHGLLAVEYRFECGLRFFRQVVAFASFGN